MSTIKDTIRYYDEKLRRAKQEIQDEECEVLRAKLRELDLDGRVKRIDDGKIGMLKVIVGYDYGVEIKFYPFTKDKSLSKNASGYCWKIEEEFEPALQGDTE